MPSSFPFVGDGLLLRFQEAALEHSQAPLPSVDAPHGIPRSWALTILPWALLKSLSCYQSSARPQEALQHHSASVSMGRSAADPPWWPCLQCNPEPSGSAFGVSVAPGGDSSSSPSLPVFLLVASPAGQGYCQSSRCCLAGQEVQLCHLRSAAEAARTWPGMGTGVSCDVRGVPPLKSSEPDLVELGRAGFCLASCVQGRGLGPAAPLAAVSLEEGEEECGEQLRHEEGEQEVRGEQPSALSPRAPSASSSAKVLAAIRALIALPLGCSRAGRELLQSHPSQQPRGDPCRGDTCVFASFLKNAELETTLETCKPVALWRVSRPQPWPGAQPAVK